jgi:hypothetical protein
MLAQLLAACYPAANPSLVCQKKNRSKKITQDNPTRTNRPSLFFYILVLTSFRLLSDQAGGLLR